MNEILKLSTINGTSLGQEESAERKPSEATFPSNRKSWPRSESILPIVS